MSQLDHDSSQSGGFAVEPGVQEPDSGAWAIGILVGIQLIMNGWAMIAVGAVTEQAVDEASRA